MLKKLEVLNGELSLKFDPLNTIYTVNVNDDVMELQFDYETHDNDNVLIIGNNLQNSVNEVIVRVNSNEEIIDYHFTVYKNDKVVSNDMTYLESLEIKSNKNELPSYVGPLVGVICFLLIVIMFTLLFKKSKIKVRKNNQLNR